MTQHRSPLLLETSPTGFTSEPKQFTEEMPCWSEIVVDLLIHALDILTLNELLEVFEDLEILYPELPRGSLFDLLKEFQSLEVRTRIAPDFNEKRVVHAWAEKRGIPYFSGCVAGKVKSNP